MKKIYIYRNDNDKSKELSDVLTELLTKEGFDLTDRYSPDTDLAVSVGGDGAMLRTIQSMNFAGIPVIGINTGHLGFFTEFGPDGAEKLVETVKSGSFVTQEYRTIRTTVDTGNGTVELTPALNDVLVRHRTTSMIHLKISVGDTFIENFSGDGVIIASPAGSTAYNYSLGGSIVDPRLALLQVTPVAPANNVAFRSFTSSILLPPEQELVISPDDSSDGVIVIDGVDHSFERILKVTVSLSENAVRIARLPDLSLIHI